MPVHEREMCFFSILNVLLLCMVSVFTCMDSIPQMYTHTNTQSLYFNFSPCSIINEHNIFYSARLRMYVCACVCMDALMGMDGVYLSVVVDV